MAINFNTDPYWDDFEAPTAIDGLSPKEKYNKILFRPGVPLQARELTQLQSQLQHQISSIGDHAFKEGAMIIPGGVTVSADIDYIKIELGYTGAISDYIGLTLENASGENKAVVVHAIESADVDPATLFINYISGDGTFAANDVLSGGGLTATIGNDLDVTDFNTIGKGSIVSIEEGIYYVRKHFVVVKTGTIVVSKYDTDVTSDVGFFVTESIVGPGEDVSLNDNAIGSPNHTAPGAHRLSISTTLGVKPLNTNSSNFVLLARLDEGRLVKQARTTDYALIEETLARRTFDESGNYTVNPFVATLQPNADPEYFTLSVEPAKAYIYGHEVEILSNTPVPIKKARETQLDSDQTLNITGGSYIDVSLPSGGVMDLPAIGSDVALFSSGGSSFLGNGTIRSISQIIAGGLTAADDRYRVYLYNIDTYTADVMGLAGIASGYVMMGVGAQVWDVDTDPNKVNYSFAEDSNIYRLPSQYTVTCNSDITGNTANFNYRYEVIRNVGTTNTITSNTVIFTLTTPGEQFTDKDSKDWLLYYLVDGLPSNANIKTLARRGDFNVVFSSSSTIATITITDYPTTVANPDGMTCQLVAPIVKTANHRTKLLKEDVTMVLNTIVGGYDVDFTKWVDIGEVDVTQIKSIKLNATNTTTPGGDNLLEHFLFDDGQRVSHYESSKIKLKPTTNYVVDQDSQTSYTIVYDHFEHGAGHFFNVDSYAGSEYDDIPSYEGIELRDAIDFRTSLGESIYAPRAGSVFETDLQYYIARIDKVALDSTGEFRISEGSPSLRPTIPDDLSDAMTVFSLLIPPYTKDPSEVRIKHVDNKRYTMRDIGKLDKRINHLEYYTSLNLLENVARNQQVFDGTILNRFKTGFVADPFVNSAVARVTDPEYHAAIDRQSGICRPTFEENNISLGYLNDPSTTVQTGDLITLPYTEEPIVSQLQSSNTINVNPFDVFNWTGTLSLSPSTDEWKEVQQMPDVIINDDSQYDSLLAAMESTTATGTIWNEWETNWTGSTSQTQTNTWDEGWRSGTQDTTTTTHTGVADRTGITTEIVPSTVIQHQGDRIVEVNFIPYMRSREVICKVTRCRPLTQLYPFFDGVDVSAYVTENTSVLDLGFSMDGAIAALLSHTQHPAGQTTITTDDKGELEFSFWIPNNDDLNFTTGTKDLSLVDDAGNDIALITTSATAEYAAKGLLEKKENVTISTRVPKIVRTDASQTKNVTKDTRSVSNRKVTWVDPLAQTIKIDKEGGVFITSLDLFFTTRDEVNSTPVTVQLLEVENGIPTQTLLPFGETTVAASLISTTGATKFTFESPVFLQESREYCFVIMSNCNSYNVQYGTIGERDDNDIMIQSQPYGGVMFKSANASTWTPMQDSDLKFVLHRATFDTTAAFTANLVPNFTPPQKLVNNPFTTTLGNGSVQVSHPNHGLNNNDYVVFQDATTIGTYPTGVTLNDAAGFQVTLVHDGGYTIALPGGAPASFSGIGGGTLVTAQGNVIWNVVYPYIQQLTLPGTNMSWTIADINADSYTTSELTSIDINSNYSPITTRKCLSALNASNSSQSYGGVALTGLFTSDRDNLSPVVDLERCSLITVHNNINALLDTDTRYVAETDPHLGTALGKYITKTVTLNDESNDLKVWVDCHRPTLSNIEVYCKHGHQSIDDMDWTPMTGIVPYTDTQGEFVEVAFESDIGTDGTFTMFAIKIVFLSSNTSRVPMVKNFRAIAVI